MSGILVAVACFWAAASLYPGGYDWRRDCLSTLLRGAPGPARMTAIAGLLIFCMSIALLFDRLVRAIGSSGSSKVVRIGGIGAMVYASLSFTPMYDMMVLISLIFLLIAILALLYALYASRQIAFLVTGIVCFVILVASATIYYTGTFMSVLPWAQRMVFAPFSIWLIALDMNPSRLHLAEVRNS